MGFEAAANAILEKLRDISKTETVIGKPITVDDTTLIPISKVTMGFGLGTNSGKKDLSGSGGGVTVEPIAFIMVRDSVVKVLPIAHTKDVVGKLVDLIPDAMQMLKTEDKK